MRRVWWMLFCFCCCEQQFCQLFCRRLDLRVSSVAMNPDKLFAQLHNLPSNMSHAMQRSPMPILPVDASRPVILQSSNQSTKPDHKTSTTDPSSLSRASNASSGAGRSTIADRAVRAPRPRARTSGRVRSTIRASASNCGLDNGGAHSGR